MRPSAAERFWTRVEVTDSCWLWTGKRQKAGYGTFRPVGRRDVYVHRWAWEQLVGPIPAGLFIDHVCRVRRCVNPTHLRCVTPYVNVTENTSNANMAARSATHCRHGHAWAENLRRSAGSRYCAECNRIRGRKARSNSHQGNRCWIAPANGVGL